MKRRFPLFIALLLGLILSSSAQMVVHHINVGQADATLLEFTKAAVLVDAGGSGTAGDPDRKHLSDYLESFFARRTDLHRTLYSLIISHPHIDHTKYLMDVLNGFHGNPPIRVQNLVDNGDDRNSSGSSQVKNARAFLTEKNDEKPNSMIYNSIQDAKITKQGYTTSWFRTLRQKTAAEIIFLNGLQACKNRNNDSVVVLVRYAGVKVLLAGDSEWDSDNETCVPAIPRMLDKYRRSSLLNVDIYKVGHHGSPNGTNDDYLEAMSPKISIISAGYYKDRQANNGPFDAWNYGHPRKTLIEELERFTTGTRQTKEVYGMTKAKGDAETIVMHKAVYCTCWDGDIRINISARGTIRVHVSK
ncbi:MAG: MBL fold metallo-hydrolase [Acidobacteria bacterium]|nr:MBL fold metallo-hydrolase [Acidobacteriota bacterium]